MAASARLHPTGNLRAISASADEITPPPRGLYIGVAGTISFTNQSGDTVALMPVVAGSVLPFQPKAITALGGGATAYGFFDD